MSKNFKKQLRLQSADVIINYASSRTPLCHVFFSLFFNRMVLLVLLNRIPPPICALFTQAFRHIGAESILQVGFKSLFVFLGGNTYMQTGI